MSTPPTLQTVTLNDYTPPIKLKILPLSSPCGNKDTTDSTNALNTGLSIWFGARNLIGIFPSILEALKSQNIELQNILELGAGTGLTGIWLYNNIPVTSNTNLELTDGVSEVLPLLTSNINLNPPPASLNVTPSELLWGGKLPKTYNFIYGADLIYERVDGAKVRLLAQTVRSGLSGVDWVSKDSSKYTNEESDEYEIPECAEIIFEVTSVPFFLLAFTRRSFPFNQLIEIFNSEGLKCTGLVEGGCFDIFENDTDGLTDMWRDCVLGFEAIE